MQSNRKEGSVAPWLVGGLLCLSALYLLVKPRPKLRMPSPQSWQAPPLPPEEQQPKTLSNEQESPDPQDPGPPYGPPLSQVRAIWNRLIRAFRSALAPHLVQTEEHPT